MESVVAADRLVVGGDGLIGAALARHLARSGPVLSTTRRHAAGPMRPFVDLAEASTIPPLPPGATAWLLAAVTNQAACRADPVSTRRINVEHVADLARTLVGGGAFVAFASTNLVFDGTRPFCPAAAALSPIGIYGRQKAEAETRLLALGPSVAIVRLSKILTAATPLIAGWIAALKAGRPIAPLSDLICAPIPLGFAVDALVRVGESRRGGIFQLSGAQDVSYADLAFALARRLGVDSSLVRPTTSAAAGIHLEAAPRYASLDASRVAREFALTPPTIEAVVDTWLDS